MGPDHIVKSFDEELQQLKDFITRMGGLAEQELASAIEALTQRNSDLANEVRDSDKVIDALELELEESAVKMIALRQPVASDLREVVSALKISQRPGTHWGLFQEYR